MIFYKDKFREIRERLGLTLEDVASACGVSKQTVQKWEKHEYLKPKPSRIQKIAVLFRCSPEEFSDFEHGERRSRRLSAEELALSGANVSVSLPTDKAVEAFRQGLLREIILADLDPVAKDKVLKIIAEFRRRSED